MKKLSVKIKVPFSYEVFFARDVFNCDNLLIARIISSGKKTGAYKVLFAVEKKILKFYPDLPEKISTYCEKHKKIIALSSAPIAVFGGEGEKSFEIVERLCGIIEKNHLCRHSFICIIGGGAFLDALGFAASIVHRGIRQIRFPTTVLSQNDSGIGVKNGINMFGRKNFIGTFAPPFAVINDLDFLDTLEQRDWISGIAEAFKIAMIRDSKFFSWLCKNTEKLKSRNKAAMEMMIRRCAGLHARHIEKSGDPFEFGSARPLDFGHWAAHKLEMMSGGNIRHGEAVAIGLALDSFYAARKGFLNERDFNALIRSLKKLDFCLWSNLLLKKNKSGNREIFSGIEEFREHLGGKLHITLPNGLGKKTEVNKIETEIYLEAIGKLHKKGTSLH